MIDTIRCKKLMHKEIACNLFHRLTLQNSPWSELPFGAVKPLPPTWAVAKLPRKSYGRMWECSAGCICVNEEVGHAHS